MASTTNSCQIRDPKLRRMRQSIPGAVIVAVASLVASCGRQPDAPSAQGIGGSGGGAELETPWTVRHDGVDCVHPKVDERCTDGWCEIPAGCFLMGSPDDDPHRIPGYEDLVTVTLTHGLRMRRTEITQGEWLELVGANPSGTPPQAFGSSCLSNDCPVDMVSWQEALAFANRMSTRDGYPECYELIDCQGELGKHNFTCGDVRLTSKVTYDCAGYRLPTEAEWEYAARAGTRTTFYSGNLAAAFANIPCTVEVPILEGIAWYCRNSGNRSHAVAQKTPNAWGLHDMVGNVAELTSWLVAEPDPPGPLVDPQASLGRFGGDGGFFAWVMKGGAATTSAASSRLANSHRIVWTERSIQVGFRIVQTL